MAVQVLHPLTAVEVGRPEMGILQGEASDHHNRRIADIHQAGTLLILVGALGIPPSAQPKGLPGAEAVAVHRTLAAHGEAMHAFHIDQRGEIGAGLALDAGLLQVIVSHIVAAQEQSARLDIQVCALLEVQRAGLPHTLGDDHHTARFRAQVDHALDLCRVDFAVIGHTVFVQPVLFAQLRQRRDVGLVEPIIDRGAIGKKLTLVFHVGLLLHVCVV